MELVFEVDIRAHGLADRGRPAQWGWGEVGTNAHRRGQHIRKRWLEEIRHLNSMNRLIGVARPVATARTRELRVDHVLLLGDSIFDNAVYVRSEPSVLEHVRQAEMTRTTRVGSKPRRSRPRPKPRAQVVKSSLSSQKSTLTSPNRNSQTKRSRRSRNSNRFPPKRGLQRLLIHKRHHLTENLRGAQSTHSGGKIRSGREGPVAAGIRTAKSVYAEQAAARVINVSVDELFAIADRFRCPRTHEQAEEWQGPERPELA